MADPNRIRRASADIAVEASRRAVDGLIANTVPVRVLSLLMAVSPCTTRVAVSVRSDCPVRADSPYTIRNTSDVRDESPERETSP